MANDTIANAEETARQLFDILSHHAGERGESEGAVETLSRIIKERDEVNRRLYGADHLIQASDRARRGLAPAPNPKPAPPYEPKFNEPITHESGATRSQLKPHYASIDVNFIRRLALIHTGAPKGAESRDDATGYFYHGGDLGYGELNWRLGLPMQDTFGHLIEHLMGWIDHIIQGKLPRNDELAAAAWNIEVMMRFERQYAVEYSKLQSDMAAAAAAARSKIAAASKVCDAGR